MKIIKYNQLAGIKMISHTKYIIIFILLILCAILLFEAIVDSGTYDEVAHITAGYTYLYKKDFRLYPDNPPLIKMISVLPWLPFKNNIKFPDSSPSWTNPLHIDQWSLGTQFLYQSNNNADKLIFLARLPVIIFTILLGLLVFKISQDFFGPKAAIFALLLFALSPDIRAHGHLATTDVGATFFGLLGTYMLWKSMKFEYRNPKYETNSNNQNTKITPPFLPPLYLKVRGLGGVAVSNFELEISNLMLATISGFFFGLAFLSKYSMILLFFSCLTVATVYLLIKMFNNKSKNIKKIFIPIFLKLIFIAMISYITLWSVSWIIGYTHTTFSYSKVPLNQSAQKLLHDQIGWKIIHVLPIPYYYQVGLETMYARNSLTQPTYIYGYVFPTGGWKFFFPLSYILKTPIPILIFLFLSISYLISKKNWQGLLPFAQGAVFFAIITIIGNLTIGTRFYYPSTVLFIITAGAFMNTSNLNRNYNKFKAGDAREELPKSLKTPRGWQADPPAGGEAMTPPMVEKTEIRKRQEPQIKIIKKNIVMIILISWLLLSNLLSFPYDISYINILGGGTMNGYKTLTDSNYDWGQDLKRFADWYKKYIIDRKDNRKYGPEDFTGRNVFLSVFHGPERHEGKSFARNAASLKDTKKDIPTKSKLNSQQNPQPDIIKMSYFGTADPAYYGIKYKILKFEDLKNPKGIYVISATNLMLGGIYTKDRLGNTIYDDSILKNLQNSKPIARIGTTIFVYEF